MVRRGGPDRAIPCRHGGSRTCRAPGRRRAHRLNATEPVVEGPATSPATAAEELFHAQITRPIRPSTATADRGHRNGPSPPPALHRGGNGRSGGRRGLGRGLCHRRRPEPGLVGRRDSAIGHLGSPVHSVPVAAFMPGGRIGVPARRHRRWCCHHAPRSAATTPEADCCRLQRWHR